jgi:predicted transcriptional regulator
MTDAPTLYPTKTRLDLLRAVENRRVFTANGITVRRTDGDQNLNRRCDAVVREMEAAGWVRLGNTGTYELTDAGRDLLEAAR